MAALLVALALTAACAANPHRATPRTAGAPIVTVDVHATTGVVMSPDLFGLGVDLPSATYSSANCAVFAGVGRAAALVRIGAATADDYDWHTDSYYSPESPGRRPSQASQGCPDRGPAASILRVLAKARELGAKPVVVLNGESDDPQGAYGLVALIARRFGYPFARAIYWEIGDAPAQWRYFGVPLSARAGSGRFKCSPDQYAASVTGYAAAIKAALDIPSDREGPRVVADAWITNATDQAWTGVVTDVDTRYYPFVAADPATASAVAAGVTAPPSGAIPLDDVLSGLRANLNQYSGAGNVGLFVGQWNINADPSAAGAVYNSAGQAAFVANLLAHAARDGAAMAAWASPLYGSSMAAASQQAPIVDNQPAPGLRVFTALRALAGSRILPLAHLPHGFDGLALRRPDGGVSIVLTDAAAGRPATVDVRLTNGPTGALRASLQTFGGASTGVTRAIAFDPAGARITVPAPGVAIVALPAR